MSLCEAISVDHRMSVIIRQRMIDVIGWMESVRGWSV